VEARSFVSTSAAACRMLWVAAGWQSNALLIRGRERTHAMKLRPHVVSPSVAHRIAVICAAVVVVTEASTTLAAGGIGTSTAASCTDAALNNGDGRWAAVISNIGVLREWFVDRGYPVGAYTDEQLATALLAESSPCSPYMWLSTAHMDETFKYLRKHPDF